MRNIFLFLVTMLCTCFVSVNAGEQTSEKSTFLYCFSHSGEHIGSGRELFYDLGNANFKIRYEENFLTFWVEEIKENQSNNDYWHVTFKAPEGQKLVPGIYKKAKRFKDESYAGFSFSGCGRACAANIGNFEIKELEIDDNGIIVALAINFTQHCGNIKDHPLFGAIRYNSSIPVEVSLSQFFGTRRAPDSLLYYKIKKPDGQEAKFFKTSDDLEFSCSLYDEDNQALIIKIGKDDDLKKVKKGYYFYPSVFQLELFTSNENGFIQGLHEVSPEKDSHNVFVSDNFRVLYDDLDYFKGGYKVIKIEKNKRGKIKELAINFKAYSREGSEMEGVLRYNTNVLFNLINPFNLNK